MFLKKWKTYLHYWVKTRKQIKPSVSHAKMRWRIFSSVVDNVAGAAGAARRQLQLLQAGHNRRNFFFRCENKFLSWEWKIPQLLMKKSQSINNFLRNKKILLPFEEGRTMLSQVHFCTTFFMKKPYYVVRRCA